MPDSPYRQAQLIARRFAGRLEVSAALEIQKIINAYARRLEAFIRTLPPEFDTKALQASLKATNAAARQLDREIAAAVRTNRTLSFNGVLRTWEKSTAEVAAARGVSSAALGAVRVSPVSMLGQFATLSGGTHWRTLVRVNAVNAAAEANQIILAAAQEGIGPEALARRLRRYVDGSEPFKTAFADVPTKSGTLAKIDLRTIPLKERGATRQMVNNSRRIAFSELHNARAEAEVQHMANDPFIAAVEWTLSPVRSTSPDSTFVPPDECDFIASQDLYGLGEGIYPVDKVPPPPHPYDRCEKIPVTRATKDIAKPKPQGLAPSKSRVLDGKGPPGEDRLTPAKATRMRKSAWDAVNFGIRGAP